MKENSQSSAIYSLGSDTTQLILHFLQNKQKINVMRLVSKHFKKNVDEYYASVAYAKSQIIQAIKELGFLVNQEMIFTDIPEKKLSQLLELLQLYKKFRTAWLISKLDLEIKDTIDLSETKSYSKLINLINEFLNIFPNNPIIITIANQEKKIRENLQKTERFFYSYSIDQEIKQKIALPLKTARKNGDESSYFHIIGVITHDAQIKKLSTINCEEYKDYFDETDEILQETSIKPYSLIRILLSRIGIPLPDITQNEEEKYPLIKFFVAFIFQFDWDMAFIYPKWTKNSLLIFFKELFNNKNQQREILLKMLLGSGQPNLFFYSPWSTKIIIFLCQLPLFIQHAFLLRICVGPHGELVFDNLIKNKTYLDNIKLGDLAKERLIVQRGGVRIWSQGRFSHSPSLVHRHPNLIKPLMDFENESPKFSPEETCVLLNTNNICWSIDEIKSFIANDNDKAAWILCIPEVVTYWPMAEALKLMKADKDDIYQILKTCQHRGLIFRKFSYTELNQLQNTNIDGNNTALQLLCRDNTKTLCDWIFQQCHTPKAVSEYISSGNILLLYQFPNPDLLMKLCESARPINFNNKTDQLLGEILRALEKAPDLDTDKYLREIVNEATLGKPSLLIQFLKLPECKAYAESHSVTEDFANHHSEIINVLMQYLCSDNIDIVLTIPPSNLVKFSPSLITKFLKTQNNGIKQWLAKNINEFKDEILINQLHEIFSGQFLERLEQFCDLEKTKSSSKWIWINWGEELLLNCPLNVIIELAKSHEDNLLTRIQKYGKKFFMAVINQIRNEKSSEDKFLASLLNWYEKLWLSHLEKFDRNEVIVSLSLDMLNQLASAPLPVSHAAENYLEFLVNNLDAYRAIYKNLKKSLIATVTSDYHYRQLVDIILAIPKENHENFYALLHEYFYADILQLYQNKEVFNKLLKQDSWDLRAFFATCPEINTDIIDNFVARLETAHKRKAINFPEVPPAKKLKQAIKTEKLEEEQVILPSFT